MRLDTVVCICVENHIGFGKAQETTNYLNSKYSRMGGIYRMMLNYLMQTKRTKYEILSSGCTASVN